MTRGRKAAVLALSEQLAHVEEFAKEWAMLEDRSKRLAEQYQIFATVPKEVAEREATLRGMAQLPADFEASLRRVTQLPADIEASLRRMAQLQADIEAPLNGLDKFWERFGRVLGSVPLTALRREEPSAVAGGEIVVETAGSSDEETIQGLRSLAERARNANMAAVLSTVADWLERARLNGGNYDMVLIESANKRISETNRRNASKVRLAGVHEKLPEIIAEYVDNREAYNSRDDFIIKKIVPLGMSITHARRVLKKKYNVT